MLDIQPPDWQKWDISYLSPSHLNKFADCKSAWLAHYLYGVREEGLMTAALRGQAVEYGIEQYLMGEELEAGVEVGKKFFMDAIERIEEQNGEKIHPVTYHSEYATLDGYIKNGCVNFDILMDDENAAKLGFGKFEYIPSSEQERKLELYLDKYNITLMGYYDYAFQVGKNKEAIKIDNKATGRMPTYDKNTTSDLINFVIGKPQHRKQVAFYAMAGQEETAMLSYSTPKKAGIAVLDKKEIESEYNALLTIVDSISTILSVYEGATNGDVEKSKYLVSKTYSIYNDLDTFYWKGKQDYIDRAFETVKGWNKNV